MVKGQVSKTKRPSRQATGTKTRSTVAKKTPTKTRRHDDSKPNYRHYSSYRPSKPNDFTTSRHHAKSDQPVKHRTHAEILRRRRIVATIAVCLLVIGGVVAAKILVGDDTARKTNDQITKVEKGKNIEPALKPELELSKEKAEQNLGAIGSIVGGASFSADNIVKLKVPVYKQVYRQSCEAASLRMALKYRGIETTDLAVLELMKYDDQPAKKVNGAWQWNDPHQMFVGDKDGDQIQMTGYGVFGEPIAMASEQLGRPVAVHNDVKPDWLARQIYAGNPVVLWGVSTKIKDEKWQTPAGQEITAPIRTHTRLVIGVKGDPANPTGFWLNDPAGTVIYWTTAQLIANVAQGIKQAVAIY
jgi:uncharacterized protein YvpB